jgi:hypothetical protein
LFPTCLKCTHSKCTLKCTIRPSSNSCRRRCHRRRGAATATLALSTPQQRCPPSPRLCRADSAALPTLPPHCLHRYRRRHRCRRASTPTAKLKESSRRRSAAASLPAMLPPSCRCNRQAAVATVAALPLRCRRLRHRAATATATILPPR